jgi:hypothetical protein
MNVSIMQPYLFPYIGYFQLMASADIFVVHDDVQYIKGGWINRNRILSSGEPRWVTLPVAAGAHPLNINQRGYAPGRKAPASSCGASRPAIALRPTSPRYSSWLERSCFTRIEMLPCSTRTHSGASPNRSESRLRWSSPR